MDLFFIQNSAISDLLKGIAKDYDTYVLNWLDENLHYEKFNPESDKEVIIGEFRPYEPIKSFFTLPKEKVASYKVDISQKKPIAIIGAKACNLHSLKIQDYVFIQGDFKDPVYMKARENALIVSADCTSFKDVCFCLAMGVEPFPNEGFDLNFSAADDGYLVKVGSKKGKAVIENNKGLFRERSDKVEEVEKHKKEFHKALSKSIEAMGMPEADLHFRNVDKGFDSEVWNKEGARCVECGACNLGCPTCHCFLLYDSGNKDDFERLKVWDSCLYKKFAEVAGGANPRKYRAERLRNRFIKKFVFFKNVLDIYACTGCGRCIEACMGKIDIREVLKELGHAGSESL